VEIKIGKKYKANPLFIKEYGLSNEFVKLSSLSGNTAIILNNGKSIAVRLSFFLENIIDLKKAIESIPRSVEDWKNEHISAASVENNGTDNQPVNPPEGGTPDDAETQPQDGGVPSDIPEEITPEDEPTPSEPEDNTEPPVEPEPTPVEEDPWSDPYPYEDDGSYPY